MVSDSLRAGRLGVERVSLIDDGGVIELEEVSIVDDDFPETSSTLCDGVLWKVAFDRRRRSLKNGMAKLREKKTKLPCLIFFKAGKLSGPEGNRLRLTTSRPASHQIGGGGGKGG